MVIIAPMAAKVVWTTPDSIPSLLPLVVGGYVVGVVPAAIAGFMFMQLSERPGHRFVHRRRLGGLALGALAGGISSALFAAFIVAMVGRGFSVDGASLAFVLIMFGTTSGAACGLASLAPAPDSSFKPTPSARP